MASNAYCHFTHFLDVKLSFMSCTKTVCWLFEKKINDRILYVNKFDPSVVSSVYQKIHYGTFYQHLIKLYRCCDLADEVSWIHLLLCSVCVCVICSWRFKSIQFYLYNRSSQQHPFQGALYFKENIFPYWRGRISLIRWSPTKNVVAVGRKSSLLKGRDLHQNKEHWEDKTQIYWK